MHINLAKYLSERVEKDYVKKTKPGPVITFSREYGCPAKIIASKLAEELTNKAILRGKDVRWKYITKEIMAESARMLQVDPEKIKYVFAYEHKGLLDDVLAAQSNKYYKSDKKIRNTIAKVIRNMANEGNVIIIGRGGVAITRDIQDSLHIMLEAPLEWRAARIAENYNISIQEAKRSAIDVDRKRKAFREYFQGKGSDYTRFDVTFNCMTLSIEEIIKIACKIAEVRKLI